MKWLLALLALLLLPIAAEAACPGTSLQETDANGVKQTVCWGGAALAYIPQGEILDIGGVNGLSIDATGKIGISSLPSIKLSSTFGGLPLDIPIGGISSRALPVEPASPFQPPMPVGGTVTALGGPLGSTAITPKVTAGSYSSGNCLGGFQPIQIPPNKLGGWVNSILVTSVGGTTSTLTPYLFDQKPAASVCTDNSTFTLAAADLDKMLYSPTSITLAAPTGATPSAAEVAFTPPRSFPPGVQVLWVGLVAGSTFTPGSTTDVHIKLNYGLVN